MCMRVCSIPAGVRCVARALGALLVAPLPLPREIEGTPEVREEVLHG